MFGVYFSPHQRNIYVNTNSRGNQSWNKNKEIYIHPHLFQILMLKILFFYVELNLLSTISNFSQFHEGSQKQPFADVLQNRCSKKFRNILNSKESPTQVFSCEYCKIFKYSFFAVLLQWLLLHYFKSN